MAFTQAHLDAIGEAISTGVQRVRYPDGREVSYQSTSDMLKAEQRIRDAVAAQQPGARRRRQTPAYRNGC